MAVVSWDIQAHVLVDLAFFPPFFHHRADLQNGRFIVLAILALISLDSIFFAYQRYFELQKLRFQSITSIV